MIKINTWHSRFGGCATNKNMQKEIQEVVLERYFIHENVFKHDVICDKNAVHENMDYKTIGFVWSTAPEHARYDWEVSKVMACCEAYC